MADDETEERVRCFILGAEIDDNITDALEASREVREWPYTAPARMQAVETFATRAGELIGGLRKAAEKCGDPERLGHFATELEAAGTASDLNRQRGILLELSDYLGSLRPAGDDPPLLRNVRRFAGSPDQEKR
ncbi:MAG: hypothetical protein IVW52_04825 [Acidimicrobiales bacterium]|nr:hypothetical protein [Acidimicrobiales bacterium]